MHNRKTLIPAISGFYGGNKIQSYMNKDHGLCTLFTISTIDFVFQQHYTFIFLF